MQPGLDRIHWLAEAGRKLIARITFIIGQEDAAANRLLDLAETMAQHRDIHQISLSVTSRGNFFEPIDAAFIRGRLINSLSAQHVDGSISRDRIEPSKRRALRRPVTVRVAPNPQINVL